MKSLICTVGLPRSGKTVWAKQQGYPIVCPDAIRLALHGQKYVSLAEPFVWAIAKLMVRALFLAGHGRVILDATNNSKKRRVEWLDDEWQTYWRPITTSPGICRERAISTDRQELLPVIDGMAEQSEELTLDERMYIWT